MKRFPKASPACYLFPGLRSPFGKVGGMLTGNRSPLLGSELTRAYLQRLDLDPEIFDGVVVGEVYTTPTHPSPARYIARTADTAACEVTGRARAPGAAYRHATRVTACIPVRCVDTGPVR